MLGLWLEDGQVRLRDDLPIPEPGPGEALLRVRLAGVCATDLEMIRGYYPFTGIMGHEFVGEVVRAPDAPEWEGRRVVGEINISCGTCRYCRRGLHKHCENRTVLGIWKRNGVFAEYVTLPIANLHAVPESVPDEAAVFTEPLAAAMEYLERVHIRPSDRVLVVGAGRLGQLVAWVLSFTGADLQAVARHPRQRELLAAYHIPTLSEDEVEPGAYDVVVEATGNPSGLALARRAVRPQGTIVLKSTYAGEVTFNFSPVVVDEITLVGSRCGPFPAALRHLEAARIQPQRLIDARYPLRAGLDALRHAAQPGVFKVLIDPTA
ncbi:MAG: alcohol dehydrogenase catalytic domain-containing protein [Chloroflexi bacterium]|nr:alcohol dehydrogenase catalytic domain-containing protein [Chloroflexota bacterium]